MSFTAKDVMTLRERTGVGMMDCKKALTETNGDMDKAIDYLREKGIATAAKRQVVSLRKVSFMLSKRVRSAFWLKSTANPTLLQRAKFSKVLSIPLQTILQITT